MPSELDANLRAACKMRGSLPSGKTTRFGWRLRRTVSFEMSDIDQIISLKWSSC